MLRKPNFFPPIELLLLKIVVAENVAENVNFPPIRVGLDVFCPKILIFIKVFLSSEETMQYSDVGNN